MSFFKTDTSWGFSIGESVFFSCDWDAYILLDWYTKKHVYALAYNFKTWRESDIWIKVTPPWDQVINRRPKRFEFRKTYAPIEF